MAAPIGNKNAEKWTEEKSLRLFEKIVELSKNPDYDFIGEIARDLGFSRHHFDEMADQDLRLKKLLDHAKSNLEANCFGNSKKEKINTTMAIVSLKANHNWSDRPRDDRGEGSSRQEVIVKIVPADAGSVAIAESEEDIDNE